MKYVIIFLMLFSSELLSDELYLSNGSIQKLSMNELITDLNKGSTLVVTKLNNKSSILKLYSSAKNLINTYTLDNVKGKLILNEQFSKKIIRDIYKTLTFSEDLEYLKQSFEKSLSTPSIRSKLKNEINSNNLSYKILCTNSLGQGSEGFDNVTIGLYATPKIIHTGQFIFLSDIKNMKIEDKLLRVVIENKILNLTLEYELGKVAGLQVLTKGYVINKSHRVLFYTAKNESGN